MHMNARLVLLLTRDREFQNTVAQSLIDEGIVVLLARNVGDALQIVCRRGRELDFAIIDFADGCHGLTLLSALEMCRPELPMVVATSSDAYHAAALLCANDVRACLAKPISTTELEIVIHELPQPEHELEVA
jgi:DNA-binding NtrC family response regulator